MCAPVAFGDVKGIRDTDMPIYIMYQINPIHCIKVWNWYNNGRSVCVKTMKYIIIMSQSKKESNYVYFTSKRKRSIHFKYR